jgi:protease-4
MRGVILDSKKMLAKLKDVDEDKQVRAVVLRLDSPGGSVAPSQEIYEAVKAMSKPVVASMGSVAASGAFYIACGAKKVVANPGTLTGSIGVIMEFMNLKGLYEWAKVTRFSIKTGRFKDSGAEYRDMRPDERELLQNLVDDVLSQFKRAVAEGRKLPMKAVSEIADGRIMSGAQAKKLKLIDELGGIEDAIRIAGELAGIKGKPEVYYSDRQRPRWIDVFFSSQDEEESIARPGLIERFANAITGSIGASTTGPAAQVLAAGPGLYWLWKGE